MNKIKILIAGIIILLLTGCDAEYNLEISGGSIKESVNFTIPNTEENSKIVDEYYKSKYMSYYSMDVNKSYNYNKEKIENKKQVGMNLNYAYSIKNYEKSSLLDYCYYKKSVTKAGDYIVIETDGKTRCFYKDGTKNLDTLTINIKTDLKVIENNADKVKDGTYTWSVNTDNYENKPIKMKIDTTAKANESNFWIIVAFIIVGIVIITGLLALFMYFKNRKNNKL